MTLKHLCGTVVAFVFDVGYSKFDLYSDCIIDYRLVLFIVIVVCEYRLLWSLLWYYGNLCTFVFMPL